MFIYLFVSSKLNKFLLAFYFCIHIVKEKTTNHFFLDFDRSEQNIYQNDKLILLFYGSKHEN